jgi:hypothetical protein
MNVSPHDVTRDEDHGSVDPASPDTDDAPMSESSVDQGKSADQVESVDQVEIADKAGSAVLADSPGQATPVPAKKKRVRRALRAFFIPGEGSPRWRRTIPWVVPVAIVVGLVIGSAHAWAWTNSPEFCGETCHTMPPQFAAYELSPHSRVSCVECHIGRDFIGKQIPRKTVHTQFVFRMIFGLYEYPIYVKGMRPARDVCETCHAPTKFSDDSVRVIKHYKTDESNTPYSTYLVMKTGGGTQREGLGRGIHWHIENKVEFLSTDKLDQDIPYVRVTNADGSIDEYVDVESEFDTSSVDPSSLKTMDCMSCHNRISHTISYPVDSIESSLSRGAISSELPYIRDVGVQVLTREYADQEQAFAGIAQALDNFYKTSYPDFYATNADKVQAAITEIQRIYSVSVFKDQEVDWNTHPDNVGHVNSPGCFRCHDGKHLNAADEAVRLECNICHSVPVVVGSEDLVTDIEISHGPEPASHRNANWISLHNRAYDDTCANCHTTADDGGTSNTSFCSNSACHGVAYPYAGFDAPALREILREQLPAPPPTVAPTPSASGRPTYNSFFGPLFMAKCGSCHSENPSAGLSLTTYADAMKGSDSGPVIIPGDSAQSELVKVQSIDHFANLSVQELEAVKQWIDSGAPEE